MNLSHERMVWSFALIGGLSLILAWHFCNSARNYVLTRSQLLWGGVLRSGVGVCLSTQLRNLGNCLDVEASWYRIKSYLLSLWGKFLASKTGIYLRVWLLRQAVYLSPTWNRIKISAPTVMFLMLGTTILIEILTWPGYPRFYFMLYSTSMFATAWVNRKWGFICSMTWYWGVNLFQAVWFENYFQINFLEIFRLVFWQLWLPWFISRKAEENRRSWAELEEKVEQRTAELSETNARLKTEIEEKGAALLAKEALQEKQRETEELLRRAQKLESLGTLAAGIAHDFNNLLTIILGRASMLVQELKAQNLPAEDAEDIVRASERAANLTRQMLAYAGKASFDKKTLNVCDQIQTFSALLRSSVPSSIDLILNLDEKLPLIEVDPSQLQQVIMNLVINAAEAIGNGPGKVIVSTTREYVDNAYRKHMLLEIALGHYVAIRVRDTGCGMDEPTQSKIFDPFFTTKVTGRGLGLSALLGIVKGHGGALKVYSEPGIGTEFMVLFPVAQNQQVSDSEQQDVETLVRGDGIRVLVVDDDEPVRKLAASILSAKGYSVAKAADGVSALELANMPGAKFHVALLDMTMPRMGGVELFHRLREKDESILIVLNSGYSNEEMSGMFEDQRGPDGVIAKPYSAARLLQTIGAVVAKNRKTKKA